MLSEQAYKKKIYKKADLYKEVRAEVYHDTLKDDIKREVEEEKKRRVF